MIEELRRDFLGAQLAGDPWAAFAVALRGLDGGLTLTEVQVGVVQAAQHEIGALWESNRIGIADEHLATSIAQVVLARLSDYATGGVPVGRTVVVACVEGELHDLPARLVADYLSQAGFAVRFLGANVPTDALIDTVPRLAPDLVALSVTLSFNVPSLRAAVTGLRKALPELPVLVGGHAVAWGPTLPADLGVESCGSDPDSLVAAARRLTGART